MKIAVLIFVVSLALHATAKLTSCSIGGTSYKNNEEFKSGSSFMQKCVIDPSGYAWHTETTACLTPKGKRINPESSVTEGTWTYKCNRKADGNIGMSMGWGGSAPAGGANKGTGGTSSKTGGNTGKTTTTDGGDAMKCRDNQGGERTNGEKWITKNGSFEMTCSSSKYSAQTKIVNCIINGKKFATGTSVKEGRYTWECKKHANGSVSMNPKFS